MQDSPYCTRNTSSEPKLKELIDEKKELHTFQFVNEFFLQIVSFKKI